LHSDGLSCADALFSAAESEVAAPIPEEAPLGKNTVEEYDSLKILEADEYESILLVRSC